MNMIQEIDNWQIAFDVFRILGYGVGDPDFEPDPDSHVFGPPGPAPDPVWIWTRIRIQLRILPFSYKGVERTEIMLGK
jgi:hypothetical protein